MCIIWRIMMIGRWSLMVEEALRSIHMSSGFCHRRVELMIGIIL